MTIILYPRKPGTASLALSTTLATVADEVRKVAEPYRGMVDMTSRSPLMDADFADDFDHVTREGNEVHELGRMVPWRGW